MSATTGLRATREEIAAALSTVPGVVGHTSPPRTITRGMGWPVWMRSTPSTYTGSESTWEIHVALPSGLDEQSVLTESELIDQLQEALEEIGPVTQIEPTTLITAAGGQGRIPCLTATLTTV